MKVKILKNILTLLILFTSFAKTQTTYVNFDPNSKLIQKAGSNVHVTDPSLIRWPADILNIDQNTQIQESFAIITSLDLTPLGPLDPAVNFYSSGEVLAACPINLHGGTIEFGNDWRFSTSTTMCPQGGGGKVKGNGYGLIFQGNFEIPTGEYFKFVNNTTLEGLGHELILTGSASLIVEANTTLCLRNMILKSISNVPQRPNIIMKDPTSKLCLQNVKLALNGDYTFSQGYLTIQDDVIISGTSQFIFESNQDLLIKDHSTLIVDIGSTFSYAPTNGSRTSFKMTDPTSFLYLNGCTFKAPGNIVNNGISLTKGTLILDNKIKLENMGSSPNTDQDKAITFGGTTTVDNLNINLLASAFLNVTGYIDYKHY